MMNKKTLVSLLLLSVSIVGCDFPSSSNSSEPTSVNTSISSSQATTSIEPELLNWNLVWSDEFDYEGLPNPDKWSYDVGGGGWGNNELQYYTNADLDNASVTNGNLTITARKENIQNREYSSARLVTKNKGDFLYGRMEAKAKLPSGRGTWPAIWMLPTDWVYGGWPTSGEIDIMEHVGYDPNVVHATIHTETYNHSRGTQVGESLTLTNVFDNYHTYAIEWEPGVIRAYINETQYATFAFDVNDIQNGPSHLAWPFDQDFHFIFNIAVGGNWGGVQGVDTNIFPTSMIVDYVRVYQKAYGDNDTIEPTAVQNVVLEKATPNSVALSWDPSSDNRMVKEYIVRMNGVIRARTSVPAVYLANLLPDMTYDVQITAVDFNNNLSLPVTFSATTGGYASINDRIEAEAYLTQEGVRFEPTTDVGGGDNAGWLNVGDYLEYGLQIPNQANYRLELRIAGNTASGQLQMFANQTLKTTMDLPITGGWQVWQTVTSESFSLNTGLNTIKLQVTREGFNLNYFRIIPA
jgi:beta-glucanase (GH16 family)